MKVFVFALVLLLGGSVARAALHTEVIEYKHGDTVLEDFSLHRCGKHMRDKARGGYTAFYR